MYDLKKAWRIAIVISSDAYKGPWRVPCSVCCFLPSFGQPGGPKCRRLSRMFAFRGDFKSRVPDLSTSVTLPSKNKDQGSRIIDCCHLQRLTIVMASHSLSASVRATLSKACDDDAPPNMSGKTAIVLDTLNLLQILADRGMDETQQKMMLPICQCFEGVALGFSEFDRLRQLSSTGSTLYNMMTDKAILNFKEYCLNFMTMLATLDS